MCELRSSVQTTIHLTHLPRPDLQTLAMYWLEGNVTAAVVDLLLERAAGNPFFAEQILRYLQEYDLLEWSDEGWQLTQAAVALFAMRVLTAAGDGPDAADGAPYWLPQPVKEVVQTASVLGQTFDLRVLARMLADYTELAVHMAVAEQADIWSTGAMQHYRFRHALLRDTAYHMQLRSNSAFCTAKVADGNYRNLCPDLGGGLCRILVYHYRQSEDRAHEQRYNKLAW